MTTSRFKLKPCPFCESMKLSVMGFGFGDIVMVKCNNCEALGPRSNTEAGAANAWNFRGESWTNETRVVRAIRRALKIRKDKRARFKQKIIDNFFNRSEK